MKFKNQGLIDQANAAKTTQNKPKLKTRKNPRVSAREDVAHVSSGRLAEKNISRYVSHMAGKLKLYPHQVVGLEKLIKEKKQIVADQMGLGKTRMTLGATEYFSGAALIVVGLKVAMGIWKREIEECFPDSTVTLYSGQKPERAEQLREFREKRQNHNGARRTHYIVTTPRMVEELSEEIGFHKGKAKWGSIIVDEYHMTGLTSKKRRRAVFASLAIKYLRNRSQALFLLSGTPVPHGAQDLWMPLHLMYPKKFSSFWGWAKDHLEIEDEFFGKHIKEAPLDPKSFNQFMSPYLLRRTKQKVLPSLPDKIRQVVDIEMSREQRKIYLQMKQEAILEAGDSLIIAPNEISKLVRFRQIMVLPKILSLNLDEGGVIEALREMLSQEFASDPNAAIVVFSPFAQGLDYIESRLHDFKTPNREIYPRIYRVQGGMDHNKLNQTISVDFQKSDEPRILLGTIKSALSYTAHSANAMFFLGFEWSYDDMMQAEDRIHRIGTDKAKRYYYFNPTNTISSKMMNRLNDAHEWKRATIDLRWDDL